MSVATSIYLGDRAAVARQSTSIVDEDGAPLLLHAAESLYADIVGDLVDRGADVAAGDRFGETALHRVADLRRTDGERAARVATVLLDRGAAVDARNRDDVAPLHQAVSARNLAVAEILITRGADPNARDKRGSTALHRAVTSTGAGGTAGTDAVPLIALLVLATNSIRAWTVEECLRGGASASSSGARAADSTPSRDRGPRPGNSRTRWATSRLPARRLTGVTRDTHRANEMCSQHG